MPRGATRVAVFSFPTADVETELETQDFDQKGTDREQGPDAKTDPAN